MENEKTFLEKHAAAMVCHRREFLARVARPEHDDAFNALADYADELAARVAELEAAMDSVVKTSVIGSLTLGLRVRRRSWPDGMSVALTEHGEIYVQSRNCEDMEWNCQPEDIIAVDWERAPDAAMEYGPHGLPGGTAAR